MSELPTRQPSAPPAEGVHVAGLEERLEGRKYSPDASREIALAYARDPSASVPASDDALVPRMRKFAWALVASELIPILVETMEREPRALRPSMQRAIGLLGYTDANGVDRAVHALQPLLELMIGHGHRDCEQVIEVLRKYQREISFRKDLLVLLEASAKKGLLEQKPAWLAKLLGTAQDDAEAYDKVLKKALRALREPDVAPVLAPLLLDLDRAALHERILRVLQRGYQSGRREGRQDVELSHALEALRSVYENGKPPEIEAALKGLMNVARARLKAGPHREDALQDFLLEVLKWLKKEIPEPEALGHYFAKVLRSKLVNVARAESKQARNSRALATNERTLMGAQSNPEHARRLSELRRFLEENCPELVNEVLIWGHKAVAEAHGVSEGTLKARLSRFRALLRRFLGGGP